MIIQSQLSLKSRATIANKILRNLRMLHSKMMPQSPHGQIRILTILALIPLPILLNHVLLHMILNVPFHLKLLRAMIAKKLIVIAVHALDVILQRAGRNPFSAHCAHFLAANRLSRSTLSRCHHPEAVFMSRRMFLLQVHPIAITR